MTHGGFLSMEQHRLASKVSIPSIWDDEMDRCHVSEKAPSGVHREFVWEYDW